MGLKIGRWVKTGVCGFVMGALMNGAWAEGVEATNAAQPALEVSAAQNTAAHVLPLANVELTVAMSMQPPFSYLSDSLSEVQGIDVDLLKELQKRTGFKLKNERISFMHLGEMFDLGKEGKVDIIAGGISLTEGRRPLYDFSDAHLAAPVVLVAHKNSNINDVADLKGRTIAVERGSNPASALGDTSGLNIRLSENTSNFMCAYSVYEQRADALVMDEPMAQFYANKWEGSNLKIVKELSAPGDYGFLFKKGAHFSAHLQQAFHDMLEDGTVERIVTKHIGKEATLAYMSSVQSRQATASLKR